MLRSPFPVLFLALLALAACTTPQGPAQPSAGYPAKPEIVVIRSFEVPEGVVDLDPTLGFSLRKGAPGVPQPVRAASVGRAAAFSLADAAVAELRAAGLDAMRADPQASLPAGSALVISGVFDRIEEGRRHRLGGAGGRSAVAVDATIAYQSSGAAPQRLLDLHEDSAALGEEGNSGGGRRPRYATAGVDADAQRVGREIARAVADLARHQNWLAPAR